MTSSRTLRQQSGPDPKMVLAQVSKNVHATAILNRLAVTTSIAKCTPHILERLLATDGVAERLLCQNLSSGALGGGGVTVNSVVQAEQVYGFPTVVAASQAIDIHRLVEWVCPTSTVTPTEFTCQAVAAGSAAGLLARELEVDPAQANSCAMLYRIGVLFNCAAFGEGYEAMICALSGTNTSLTEAERTTLGFDHHETGSLALRSFPFDSAVIDSFEDLNGEPINMGPVSRCVQASSILAHQLGYSLGIGNLPSLREEQRALALGFTFQQFEAVVPVAIEAANRARNVSAQLSNLTA